MDAQTLAAIMTLARALVTLEDGASAQITQLQKQLAEARKEQPFPPREE